jgi:hypothetical protein
MRDAADIAQAVRAAEAKARHHKREARRHRAEAQAAAARRDHLKAQLARFGIGFVRAP